MKRRVVVTGIGVISPNAEDTPRFLSALKNGRSGIAKVKSFDTSRMRVQIGGEVKKAIRPSPRVDRVSQLALIAAEEAVQSAGYESFRSGDKRLGLVLGTINGGILSLEKSILKGRKDHYLRDKLSLDVPAKLIGEKFGVGGEKITVSSACAAGNTALALAAVKIRMGQMDMMLVGGCESFSRLAFCGFHALRSLDPLTCRPFDREREGLVVGEGAGFLVLEELSHAKKRGANIYAEVAGCGLSSDAYHETSPHPKGKGAIKAMKEALKDARLAPEDISYINAHGTGTPLNDAVETRAIKEVFGRKAYQIPVSSTKSMIGHLMGAAGAVEGVASILAINYAFVPPTVHYTVPDPACDLDYVPNAARQIELDYVMSSNFGFGGANAVVIFKKFVP